jgi:hypothetical protein
VNTIPLFRPSYAFSNLAFKSALPISLEHSIS